MNKPIQTLLIWLPSMAISLFYISNALSKILQPDNMDKIIANSSIMIITGIFLLLANLLFLIPKTTIWGTSLLALYMLCIVGIHMYKGKPYEVTILIVMATIFAAFIRQPELFLKKNT